MTNNMIVAHHVRLSGNTMNDVINPTGLPEYVGEYRWLQLSMWDYAPKCCIEKYITSNCGEHIFHYILNQCTEIVSDTHWKMKIVTEYNNIPDNVLNYRNTDYKIKGSL